MNYPTTRIVFDRKRTASNSKTGLVQIEVLYNRKRMFLSTGVKVYAGQWKDKVMVTSRLDSLELNSRIVIIHDNIKEYINKCIKDKKEFSFEALNKFLQLSTNSDSFINFVEKRICERQMEESTRKQHLVFFRKLQDFGIIQSFSDLTGKNIKLFDDYIKKKITNQTSIYSVHKRMKIYVKEAIQFELISKNPYEQFAVQRGESKRRKYLTPEELLKVKEAVIPNASILGVRDCFVFCCYTFLALTYNYQFIKWLQVS